MATREPRAGGAEPYELLEVGEPGAVERLAFRLDRPVCETPGRVAAAASAILYLHGFGSSQEGEKAEFFRRAAVAAGFAFASIDFRGHGRSGGGMKELTLSRNLADVDRARRELQRRGFERPVLLGSSMGGLTGLWYSALMPEAVTAGLYVAPAVDLGERAESWFGAEGLERWRREGKARIETETVSCDLGYGFVEDFRRYRLEDLGASHRTPALLVQGGRDASVSCRRVVDFAVGCTGPGVELVLFADGDHRLLDRKPRIWELMRGFLAARLGLGALP